MYHAHRWAEPARRPFPYKLMMVATILATGVVFLSSHSDSRRGLVRQVSSAIEAEPSMNAPVMNRAPISEGNLRVSSKTEATRLKGAILAKIGMEETFAVEAVGIKAIGSALKALAILGTPPRNPSFTPKKFQSSVVFKRGYSEQDDGKRLNFTIVSFEVQPKESQELSEAHIEANANTDLIVRVSRTTQVVALASKMAREFETDTTRSLYMHVMGPHAISTGMKALCVLKNMLAQSGIYNKAIFKPKFVRENGLSIVEIKVHLEQGGEEGEEGEGGGQ